MTAAKRSNVVRSFMVCVSESSLHGLSPRSGRGSIVLRPFERELAGRNNVSLEDSKSWRRRRGQIGKRADTHRNLGRLRGGQRRHAHVRRRQQRCRQAKAQTGPAAIAKHSTRALRGLSRIGCRLPGHERVAARVAISRLLFAARMVGYFRDSSRNAALRACRSQRKRGDRNAKDGDKNGSQPAHDDFEYVLVTLKVK